VIDVGGQVRSVAGSARLRDTDLGSSPLVKAAQERPSGDVWTLPEGVMVMGVAAVRSAGEVIALVGIGYEVGAPALAGIERALGVAGALIISGRLATSSTRDPAALQAFDAASALEENTTRTVGAGAEFIARVSRTGNSAAAAKAVWLRKRPLQLVGMNEQRIINWMPVVLVGITFALGFLFRKTGAQT
jgi:hypothetical protein